MEEAMWFIGFVCSFGFPTHPPKLKNPTMAATVTMICLVSNLIAFPCPNYSNASPPTPKPLLNIIVFRSGISLRISIVTFQPEFSIWLKPPYNSGWSRHLLEGSSVACFAPSNITQLTWMDAILEFFDFTKSTISFHVLSNRQFVFASSLLYLPWLSKGFTMGACFVCSFDFMVHPSYTCKES